MKTFLKKSPLFFLFLLLAFVTFSCQEDSEDIVEPTKTATITITSPATNGMVMANDSATVSGTIEAAEKLHGYSISIRRKSDNAEIFRQESHAHNTTLNFSHKWLVENITTHTELELEIIATLDHDGHTASKKVNFHAMP